MIVAVMNFWRFRRSNDPFGKEALIFFIRIYVLNFEEHNVPEHLFSDRYISIAFLGVCREL